MSKQIQNLRPIKVIKQSSEQLRKLEDSIKSERMSLLFALCRWIKNEQPEKAKEIAEKVYMELC